MRGRKPKLTFSEQIKLRTIQAAYGQGSAEEEAFWLNIRKGRDALFERKRKWGKQTAEEKRKVAKECSKRYAERHKNDPKRIEAHRIAANEWYYRHKNDPGFMEKNRKNKLAWLQKKAEKELQS